MLTLDYIRMLVSSQARVVRYEHGCTVCPVCEFAGLLPTRVTVTCTVKEVRYCTCEQCYSNFRAFGDERQKPEPEPKPEPVPMSRKPRKGGKRTRKITETSDESIKSPETADKNVDKSNNRKSRRKR